MQRDIFHDRDWFLIGLVLIGFAGIGMNTVFVAHYIHTGFFAGAWLDGLFSLLGLILFIPFTRYNRWAYLVFLAGFAVQSVLGVLRAAEGSSDFLYTYEGFLNVIFGLIFVAGLLGRWRDFMGTAAGSPGPAGTEAAAGQLNEPETRPPGEV